MQGLLLLLLRTVLKLLRILLHPGKLEQKHFLLLTFLKPDVSQLSSKSKRERGGGAEEIKAFEVKLEGHPLRA